MEGHAGLPLATGLMRSAPCLLAGSGYPAARSLLRARICATRVRRAGPGSADGDALVGPLLAAEVVEVGGGVGAGAVGFASWCGAERSVGSAQVDRSNADVAKPDNDKTAGLP